MQIILIGRGEGCNVILNDKFISRQHAQLILLNTGQILLKDLGSRNGTFVNGIRITESYLKPGDIIKCASVIVNLQKFINEPSAVNREVNIIRLLSEPKIQPQSLHQPFGYFNKIFSLERFKSNRIGNGISTVILGLALIIISTQTHLFSKKERYRVDPGILGLSDTYNLMGPVYDERTLVDTKAKNNTLYAGLAALLIGGMLLESGFNAKNRQKNNQV